MKRCRKNARGITLIALVITIIILLILAGISIRSITGEGGIIEKAKWAEFVNEYESVNEGIELYRLEKMMPFIPNSNTKTDLSMYPIKGEKVEVYAEDVPDSLRDTIKKMEELEEEQLSNEKYVKLYVVDLDVIGRNASRNYILNVISGKLYSIDQVLYNGLIYHTPRQPAGIKIEGTEEYYTIRIYKNSETASGKNIEERVNNKEDYTIPTEELFQNPGYKLLGYSTNANYDYKNPGDNVLYKKGNIIQKVVKNYYLYAIWVPEEEESLIKLRYKSGYDESEEVQYVTKYEIESGLGTLKPVDEMFSREDKYYFLGWNDITYETLEEEEDEDDPDDEKEEEEEEIEDDEVDYEDCEDLSVVCLSTANQQSIREIVLEGVWEEAKYIKVDSQGGKCDVDQIEVVEDEYIFESSSEVPEVTWEGHAFLGWFTEPTGGNLVDETTIYTIDLLNNNTIYAQWIESNEQITITFNAEINGGTFAEGVQKQKTIYKGGAIGELPDGEEVLKENVYLKGWYTEITGGTLVTSGTRFEKDTTIYAQFYTYTDSGPTVSKIIMLDANGGKFRATDYKNKIINAIKAIDGPIQQTSEPKKIGEKVGVKNKYYKAKRGSYVMAMYRKPQYKGKKFAKTWKDANGNIVKAKDIYQALFPNNNTLYAQWNEKVKITFNANGGTLSKNNTEITTEKFSGKKYTARFLRKGQYRIGYVFDGWYTSPTGGTKITKNDIIPGNDITLYAHWKPREFEIEVSSIQENAINDCSWINKIKATDGIKKALNPKKRATKNGLLIYYVSENEDLSNATAYTASAIAHTVKNMKSGATYYVWAELNGIRSTNYVEVKTPHTHVGNKNKKGVCYQTPIYCNGELGYKFYYSSSPSWKTGYPGSKYQCCNCGSSNPYYKATPLSRTEYKQCIKCEAKISHGHSNVYSRLCSSCYNSYISNGYALSYSRYIYDAAGNDSPYGNLSHITTYDLSCSITTQSGSSVSNDF